jgi:hypothetical protein
MKTRLRTGAIKRLRPTALRDGKSLKIQATVVEREPQRARAK